MFRSILVPLDGSADSAAALPVARTVASATGSVIQLLRVVPTDSETETNQAVSYLAPISQELEQARFSVDSTVGQGEPSTEILRFARARDVDLIVMATHAHGRRQQADSDEPELAFPSGQPCPVSFVGNDNGYSTSATVGGYTDVYTGRTVSTADCPDLSSVEPALVRYNLLILMGDRPSVCYLARPSMP